MHAPVRATDASRQLWPGHASDHVIMCEKVPSACPTRENESLIAEDEDVPGAIKDDGDAATVRP